MKFGGTSVGDASRIRKVVDIIRDASRESRPGRGRLRHERRDQPTDRGSHAVHRRESPNGRDDLRGTAQAARRSGQRIDPFRRECGAASTANWNRSFEEGERLCQGTTLLRELTPRARDSISSLGERLSAPLVAAALAECGVASEAIEATRTHPNRLLPWLPLTRTWT